MWASLGGGRDSHGVREEGNEWGGVKGREKGENQLKEVEVKLLGRKVMRERRKTKGKQEGKTGNRESKC